MRKRFQHGNVRKVHGSWVGRYYDEHGKRRYVTLGRASKMSKSEAKEKLSEILKPINNSTVTLSSVKTLGDFAKLVFFPRKEKKWKGSSKDTTEDRMKTHILAEFGAKGIRDFTDDD